MTTDLRKNFDLSLNELKEEMLNMFNKVTSIYVNLFNILETHNLDLAKKLVENDKRINDLEHHINDMAYLIILRQCPVATDLRRIMTAIKIANDLERIADYAENIATYLIKTKHDNTFYINAMIKFKDPLLAMLKKVEEAYDTKDSNIAFEVCEMDNTIDAIYRAHIEEFIHITMEKTDIEAEEASRGIIVIKQFERAGDHITNIAEHIIYLKSGKQLELN
ncbi:MAG: phosphate signaling complex protein PhoU [Candidatus Izemoplasmataceae bacterium]